MGARRPGVSGARPKGAAPQSWTGALDFLMLVAAVGLVLGLSYLLFILYSGALDHNIIGGTELEQYTRNVGLAKAVFLWSLWVLVLAAMVRHHRGEAMGYVALLSGGASWLILPLLVASRVPETTAPALKELGQSLVASFRTCGGLLMVVGLLRVVLSRVIALSAPSGVGRAAAAMGPGAGELAAEWAQERPSLMRQCWELHFCRGSLRASCPRFLEPASCWKRRSGCYCDEGLQTRLLSEISARARVQVAEEMEGARARAQRLSRPRRRAARDKAARPPCGECPIYLEHQKHKYRVLSWLSYPAAATIIGLSFGPIRYGYEWVESHLASLLAHVQFLPHSLTDQPYEQAPWLTAENAMVLLVGVLVVGIILQLAEFAVFRLKW